jgi:serine/threonine-protein phosphatase 2A regulatory subunit B'
MQAPKGSGSRGVQSAKVVERSNLILKNRKMMSTPRSDLIMNLGLSKAVVTTYAVTRATPLADLPDLTAVPPQQFNELMQQKLAECCVLCNFSGGTLNSNAETKTRYLQEIVDCITKPRYFQLCDGQTFDRLFEMIKANLLRALPPVPPISKSPLLGDDVKDIWVDGAWPHLSLVYDIFQGFLESPQMVAGQHIKRFDAAFFAQFLRLFDSMDGRERAAVQQVLHGLYLKFNQLRPKIRQCLQQILLTFIYETKYFNGIGELLDFYESIIGGFSVPIKPENLQLLFTILIPLHAADFLHVFYENLLACIFVFVEKDANLLPAIIRRLLLYWPSSTVKAKLFINEIGQLIDAMTEEQFKEIAEDVFILLARLVEGLNFQLSEATICLWKSDPFVTLTSVCATTTYPIIVPAVYRCGIHHWHPAIKNIAVSVLRICMQTAPDVYDQVIKGLPEIEQHMAMRQAAEKGAWLEVAKQAAGFDTAIAIVEKPTPIDQLFAA